MSLIIGSGVGKVYDAGYIFKDIAFLLSPGERVGLVGPNGQGKTTLLRMLINQEKPTEGIIQRASGLRVGYLPQDVPAPRDQSVWEAMLEVFAPLHKIETQLHEMSHDLSAPATLERYGQLQHEFEAGGGYDYENRIKTVLTGVGFDEAYYGRSLAHLSGGQRSRVALGRLLLEDSDVLLLDEPTNHLDLSAVEWLEKFLMSLDKAIIVVSHDRYFLDRVVQGVWEMAFGELDTYKGNYSAYVGQRELRAKERLRQWEAQKKYIAKTEEYVRRFIAGQRSRQAKGRRTRLERFVTTEAINRPRNGRAMTVQLDAPVRSGDVVLKVKDLCVGYTADKPLLRIDEAVVRRGERIAVVGPNGIGKSTLIKTLLKTLDPLSGTLKHGAGVHMAYLPQTHENLCPDMTAMETLRQAAEMTDEQARNMLAGFLFCGDDAFKKVCELSGGQRSRLALARLVARKANFLLLDEPTNHLDINSQEVLEDMLSDFEGSLLFVSHDRYLVQALADQVWAIEDGQITVLPGEWDAYLQWRQERAAALAAERSRQRVADRPKVSDQKPVDYEAAKKEKRRVERLSRRKDELEELVGDLEEKLRTISGQIDNAGGADKLDEICRLGEQYAQSESQLKALYAEWEEISAQLEKA